MLATRRGRRRKNEHFQQTLLLFGCIFFCLSIMICFQYCISKPQIKLALQEHSQEDSTLLVEFAWGRFMGYPVCTTLALHCTKCSPFLPLGGCPHYWASRTSLRTCSQFPRRSFWWNHHHLQGGEKGNRHRVEIAWKLQFSHLLLCSYGISSNLLHVWKNMTKI